MDELPALEILNTKPNLRILPDSLVEDSYGIVVKKGNDDLLEVVNRVIERMKEDGSLKESILRHTAK
jgi:polar amino acid transport system substrate-binding protein